MMFDLDAIQLTLAQNQGEAPLTFETRVASSFDDAEERSDGSVNRGNPDLELVFDRGGDQVVGMRFQSVPVPQGASITNAYLQFEVDETTSVATSLTIAGEASDDAPIFSSTPTDVSSRPSWWCLRPNLPRSAGRPLRGSARTMRAPRSAPRTWQLWSRRS